MASCLTHVANQSQTKDLELGPLIAGELMGMVVPPEGVTALQR